MDKQNKNINNNYGENAHLKRRTKPYSSKIIPTIGHPRRTTVMPPKKHIVALALCLWKKNLKVLCSPMTQPKPEMNNICNES